MAMASAPPYPDSVVVQQSMPTRNVDLPPAYEDSTNPNSMPPTYESLYGEFQQVDNPKGLAQFIAKVFAILVGTVTAAVLLALLNIIPLGMIVLGSVNLHRCHIEPYIPIWLIVTGVFSLLKSATNFFYRVKRQRAGQPPSPADVNPNPFDGLLSTFLLVWFIIGSVWIYSVYDEVQYTSPSDIDFCDQFTFVFSFVFVTLGYVLLALTMCCFCCCCCCICCRPKRQQLT
uniref:MARVEL domain-containing protein n=1 Tax=Ascaris lumbricoides TaxID=6252 RepID=A0A0M3IJU3_ASCLU